VVVAVVAVVETTPMEPQVQAHHPTDLHMAVTVPDNGAVTAVLVPVVAVV
jgi:hypothetical protein